MLSGAGAALEHDRLAERLEQRADALERALRAADHDHERRVASPDVASGDGRVERVDAHRARGLVDLARERRLARRHVDEHRPRTRAREHAVLAEHHLAHVAREADDGEDDVRGGRDRGGESAHSAGVERAPRPLGVRVNTVTR